MTKIQQQWEKITKFGPKTVITSASKQSGCHWLLLRPSQRWNLEQWRRLPFAGLKLMTTSWSLPHCNEYNKYRHDKVQIPLRWLSPKLQGQGKSQTHIMKVANTNHINMLRCLQQSPWQVRNKPVCVALMEFSPLLCTKKIGDKVHRLSNHESRQHELCLRLSRFVSATFPMGKIRWKSQSV